MEFEKKLKRLEDIVSSMEGGELALEKSLELFEEGVKLSKECHQQLNKAEQKVKLLMGIDDSGNPVTKDLNTEQ
jgi:exodeoxyribonuclease VII small subunit